MTLTKQDLQDIKTIVAGSGAKTDARLVEMTERTEAFAIVTEERFASIHHALTKMQIAIETIESDASASRQATYGIRAEIVEIKDQLKILGRRSSEDVGAAYIDVSKLRKRVTALEKIAASLKQNS